MQGGRWGVLGVTLSEAHAQVDFGVNARERKGEETGLDRGRT